MGTHVRTVNLGVTVRKSKGVSGRWAREEEVANTAEPQLSTSRQGSKDLSPEYGIQTWVKKRSILISSKSSASLCPSVFISLSLSAFSHLQKFRPLTREIKRDVYFCKKCIIISSLWLYKKYIMHVHFLSIFKFV